MERDLLGVRPFTVPAAVLAVTERAFPIDNAERVILAPLAFERFAFSGESPVYRFRIKVPVQLLFSRHSGLFVEKLANVLVRYILGKRIAEFFAVPEPSKELVDG